MSAKVCDIPFPFAECKWSELAISHSPIQNNSSFCNTQKPRTKYIVGNENSLQSPFYACLNSLLPPADKQRVHTGCTYITINIGFYAKWLNLALFVTNEVSCYLPHPLRLVSVFSLFCLWPQKWSAEDESTPDGLSSELWMPVFDASCKSNIRKGFDTWED